MSDERILADAFAPKWGVDAAADVLAASTSLPGLIVAGHPHDARVVQLSVRRHPEVEPEPFGPGVLISEAMVEDEPFWKGAAPELARRLERRAALGERK